MWRDEESAWTLDDSIAYWRRAVEDAENEWDHVLCMNQFYDAVTARDRKTLKPLLDVFAARYGFCPESWEDLIRAGALGRVPLDAYGDPYGIGIEDCRLVAYKKFKDQ